MLWERSCRRVHILVLAFCILASQGQVPPAPQGPCAPSPYRSADGSCNNLKNPTWGKSLGPYSRFLPPNYADENSLPRASVDKSPLPNARVISDSIAQDGKRDDAQLTTFFSEWGLFLNLEMTKRRDILGSDGKTLECCGKDSQNSNCIPIMLPENDPFYARFQVKCMSVVRTTTFLSSPPASGFREQVNNNEAFISGSPIYGSTVNDSRQVRTFANGKLRTTQSPTPSMALLPESSDQCDLVKCFLSGDPRVNLSPELVSIHTLLVRHHNLLAGELISLNPLWSDEKVYQETRRIIGAIIQLITYRDWLPLLLGPKYLKGYELELLSTGYYNGYSEYLNPSTANVFGAAALRFGHSALQHNYYRVDGSGRLLPSHPLSTTVLNPQEIYQQELDLIVNGLVMQKMSEVDQYFTEEITDRLFETRNKPGSGQDLFAINVQRGRDHGLPSYNEWREFCRLPTVASFDQLGNFMEAEVVSKLQRLYKSVEDLDLYVAGVSEYHMKGAAAGPTFACIIANQFRNSRRGDRFWFENGNHPGAFTQGQLDDIRRMSLAEVICANTGTIRQAPQNGFLVGSKPVNCDIYKRLLLNPVNWKETSPPSMSG